MKITATDDTSKLAKVTLDGNVATISAGGNGSSGQLTLVASGSTQPTVVLHGQTGNLSLGSSGRTQLLLDGPVGYGGFGGGGTPGAVGLFPANASNIHDLTQATLSLAGQTGSISLNTAQGKPRITLDGSRAYGAFGGNAWDGGLALFPAAATNNSDWSQATITFNGQAAVMGIGGAGHAGVISVQNAAGVGTVAINGDTGDIFLLNADCAEDFDLADQAVLPPGTVVVLDEEGSIRQSTTAYDKRAAGVLSGAGDFKPGLVLDRRPSLNPRLPVALMGKVFCRADASGGAIKAGDLLTTSSTPGHAMKAADQTRAFGAVIGKALRGLGEGQGLIPILVTLQ